MARTKPSLKRPKKKPRRGYRDEEAAKAQLDENAPYANVEDGSVHAKEAKAVLEAVAPIAKRKRGYDPEYHPKAVMQAMAKGCSKQELILEVGIYPAQMYEWERKYPEFKNAVIIGEQFCRAWWEKKGRVNIDNREFNNNLYLAHMQNRFGWSRKVEKTVEETKTLRMEAAIDLTALSDRELALLNKASETLEKRSGEALAGGGVESIPELEVSEITGEEE
jgi:hypothetical protein